MTIARTGQTLPPQVKRKQVNTLTAVSKEKPLKAKCGTKCKVCRTPFKKLSITHKTCSPECAIELMQRDKAKKVRKDYLAKKVSLRSRREWLKIAQQAFNAYIRKRDEDRSCISCGRHHNGQYHAGHYLSTGACPELRFNEDNCHKQCAPCNNHLSGNIALYRKGLIEKIGIVRVESLEGPHDARKWTIEELQGIKEKYARMVRELTNQRGEK